MAVVARSYFVVRVLPGGGVSGRPVVVLDYFDLLPLGVAAVEEEGRRNEEDHHARAHDDSEHYVVIFVVDVIVGRVVFDF